MVIKGNFFKASKKECKQLGSDTNLTKLSKLTSPVVGQIDITCLLIWWTKDTMSLVQYSCQNTELKFKQKERPEKSKLRDHLQNNRLVLFKSGKAMKDKGEAEQVSWVKGNQRQDNQRHGILDWILNQKQDNGETNYES